jgi:2-hydroxychromene-2-carboxylate isomerase
MWCPVLSTALFAARGVDPFRGPPASMQYDWEYRRRDATRWAALYGVPFVEPRGRLRLDPELLALAATAARGLGQGEAYAWQLFRAVFDGSTPVVDRDECLRRAALCGLAREQFSSRLAAAETREALDRTQQEALRAGVFGVPSFVVGGELFWGNDRLPLLEHYLASGSGPG